MVGIPASFRNLSQTVGGNLTALAPTADRVVQTKGSHSAESQGVVDALSDLLAGTAFLPEAEPEPPRTRYEETGYPDLLSQLWALVDRPVGRGVVRTTSTRTVETALGPVTVEVETADYVNRPLTPEEVAYLRRKGRLIGNPPVPGDLDYLTHPPRRR